MPASKKKSSKPKPKPSLKTSQTSHYKKALSDGELAKLISEKRGNISNVAIACKVSRHTVYAWIETSDELKQALKDARESMLDTAEGVLYDKVQAGDLTAIIFFLKTQGKNRGYFEKVDVGIISDIERELARLGFGQTAGITETT